MTTIKRKAETAEQRAARGVPNPERTADHRDRVASIRYARNYPKDAAAIVLYELTNNNA